jgi:hypothetical protein
MALSGTWAFTVARDDIIRQGMMNLGLLEEGEQPTATEIADCSRVLNMIVKQLAGNLEKSPGFKMYQRQRGDLFLGYTKSVYNLGPTGDNWAASTTGLVYPQSFNRQTLTAAAAGGQPTFAVGVGNTASFNVNDFCGVVVGADIFWSTVLSVNPGAGTVTLSTNLSGPAAIGAYAYNYTLKAQRPMNIKTALLRDSNGTDTPLSLMTVEQYEALPTKQQPGFVQDPTAWYYEQQLTNGQFYIDCVGAQDVTKTIHIVYLRESMDLNIGTDNAEFPQEYLLHLSWTLSLQICGMFDADWTPDRQAAYSVAVTRAAEGAEPERSADFFQVDDPDGY